VVLPDPVLIIQTAFLGDVILTLPVAEAIRSVRKDALVDMLVIPSAAPVIAGHPDVREVIVYDKRGADTGARGFLRVLRELKRRRYACAIVPHRSLRSALLARLAGIPVRAGFDRSAGRLLFTRVVGYRGDLHEIGRNLALLEALGAGAIPASPPGLYPSDAEKSAVTGFLESAGGGAGSRPVVAIAPGTAWNTKRWPADRFAALARSLAGHGCRVVILGGPGDASLCAEISAAGGDGIVNACGKFSVLGSAELIRRSDLLVCNDSAPLHLGAAMRTPVLAIFGATVPSFGFGPAGPLDAVVETHGLPCRPCSVHGGDRCPVGTFECMLSITPDSVLRTALPMLGKRGAP
jgi:heptosyltransferase-2